MARQVRAQSAVEGRLVHPLAYVRWERGWSHQDVVDVVGRRINTAARREKAWRWENWGVVPDKETQDALADELGVSHEEVRRLGWPDWLPVGRRIVLETPWTMEGGVALLDDAAGGPLDRRGFLTLSTGAVLAVAEDWLRLDPPRLASVLRGGRVDSGLVECFENRLPALRRMDHTLGGGHVGSVVDAELQLVTDLLAEGTYTQNIGQRLFAVAAELGRVAGWASCDAGLHAAAERYWVAALHAAHLARDRGIGANVLKSMSLQRTETDRVDEALALAQAARAGAKDSPPRVLAMLTVREARTYASRGEATQCERLLAIAETYMARADSTPAPDWAMYFDDSEYHAQVAACYLLLRRFSTSDRWLAGALAAQPDERSRDRATYYIWRADCAVNLGDVEQACGLLREAVPDLSSARSARNAKRLAGVRQALVKHGDVMVVRDLDEELRTVLSLVA